MNDQQCVTIHVSMMISYTRWEKLRDCEMSNVRQSRRRRQSVGIWRSRWAQFASKLPRFGMWESWKVTVPWKPNACSRKHSMKP